MEVKDAFKYCPRCGAKTKVGRLMMSCLACGLDTYFNPKPVQEIVLENEDGEILFCVRGVEPRKGFLDFPGGFVEVNETVEESLAREVKEELGIDISTDNFEYLRSNYTKYLFQGISYDVVGNSYWAKLPKGVTIVPADDVAAVKFYKPEDVPENRLAWETSKDILKVLAERKAKQR